MAKLTLTTVSSGYMSATALEANFNAIETAFENTLSRDGTTPNQMSADLDMNGFKVLNSGVATSSTELVTKGQLDDAVLAPITELDAISNVVLTSPVNTDVLTFDGTNWVNSPPATTTQQYASCRTSGNVATGGAVDVPLTENTEVASATTSDFSIQTTPDNVLYTGSGGTFLLMANIRLGFSGTYTTQDISFNTRVNSSVVNGVVDTVYGGSNDSVVLNSHVMVDLTTNDDVDWQIVFTDTGQSANVVSGSLTILEVLT